MTDKIKVWDIPTRLFHWALVSVFVFQFVTGNILDDAMQLHFYGGYVALSLILFRILWGFVGTYHARFATFVYAPSTALAYLKGKTDTSVYLGHNPLGGYSVLTILAVMLSQSVSGLFMTDDIFLNGPYYGALGGKLDDAMSYIHHNAINIMWALIALHFAAITYYSLVKKQALVPAMVHGKKALTDTTQRAEKTYIKSVKTPWLRFIVCALICATIVYLVVSVLAPEQDTGFYY